VSHQSKELRSVFEQFARMEITLGALQAALGPAWRFESAAGFARLEAAPAIEPPVAVETIDVRRALAALMSGSVPTQGVVEWANVIVLCDNYEVSPSASNRELLLRTLHELASPEIHGPITTERAAALRAELGEASASGR